MQKVCKKLGKLLFTLLYYLQWCAPGWYSISETVALYVDHLTEKLLLCNAGCYINDRRINHVMYADDIMFDSS